MNTKSNNDPSLQALSKTSTQGSDAAKDASLELPSADLPRADDADAMPSAAAAIAGTDVPGSSVSGKMSAGGTTLGSDLTGTGLKDGTSGKKEALRQELGQLKSELDTLVSHAATLSERELGEAYQLLLARFQTYRSKAKDMASNAGQQFNQQMDVTKEKVKENPVQSVAIAAGAGMLMGLVMRRRRRDYKDR